MFKKQPSPYDHVDTNWLANMIVSPEYSPDTRQGALSSLAARKPNERRDVLHTVILNVIQNPNRYDPAIIGSTIDLLATDPDVEATTTMLRLLPAMLNSIYQAHLPYKDFRDDFYMALLTRRRDEDKDAWTAALETFNLDLWVAMVLDQAARPIARYLNPLKRIDEYPKRDRRNALKTIVKEGENYGTVESVIKVARQMMRGRSYDEVSF